MKFGTGPLPRPATHRILSLGGRAGERAGAGILEKEKRRGRGPAVSRRAFAP